MPFTGYVTLRGRTYAARTVTGIAKWFAVPFGYSDGTHVNFKPRLLVEVETLKNFNTPPKKYRVGDRPPAWTWVGRYWVSAWEQKGLDIDTKSAGPRPHGKGWKKGLPEAY